MFLQLECLYEKVRDNIEFLCCNVRSSYKSYHSQYETPALISAHMSLRVASFFITPIQSLSAIGTILCVYKNSAWLIAEFI